LILHLIEKYDAVEKSDLDLFSEAFNEIDLQEIAKHQIAVKKKYNITSPPKESEISYVTEEINDEKSISSNIGGRFLKNWTNATTSASPSTTSTCSSNRKTNYSNHLQEKNESVVVNTNITDANGSIRNLNIQVFFVFHSDMI
jgi:hypothetical protein